MSASSEERKIPLWLEHCQSSPTHLSTVFETLASREHVRENARAASRHQSHPSRTHRLVHLPSTLTKDPENVNHYSVSIAWHPKYKDYNRYSDVEPYDRTRVVVGHGGAEPSGRYLNASWVRELSGGKWWIATQAPLPHTTHAYLSVLLQPISRPPPELHPTLSDHAGTKTCRIRTVVQLTQNFEKGMRKAHVYFPPIVGESWIIEAEKGCTAPSVKVALLKVRNIDEAHCVESFVSIQPVSATHQDEGELVVFRHLLYGSWPDHGVPKHEDRDALLNFVYLVDSVNRDLSDQPTEIPEHLDPDPPIMVNCSAGIGRTGSFIAISSLLRTYGFLPPPASLLHDSSTGLPSLLPSPLGPLSDEIADDLVAQEIDALREQRPGMVQRPDQVTLIYDLLITAFIDAIAGEKAQRQSSKGTH
ncbi:unnamed protein product [Somion occarium]|uniref:Phosphatases II n=1 Tax=Somion occarium TaxID=3059160 RepID=A0ABP1CG05_9APHY